MSWGLPKCASIRRPSCGEPHDLASVSAGCSRRSGSITLATISPSRTR